MKKLFRSFFVFFFIAILAIALIACKKTFKVSFNKKDKIEFVGNEKDVDLTKVSENTSLTFTVKEEKGKDVVVKVNGEKINPEGGKYTITITKDTSVVILYEEKTTPPDEKPVASSKFKITVLADSKDYIMFLNNYNIGDELEKDKQVSFKVVDIPSDKIKKTVLANDEELTEKDGIYQVIIVDKDIVIKFKR